MVFLRDMCQLQYWYVPRGMVDMMVVWCRRKTKQIPTEPRILAVSSRILLSTEKNDFRWLSWM